MVLDRELHRACDDFFVPDCPMEAAHAPLLLAAVPLKAGVKVSHGQQPDQLSKLQI